MTILWRNDTTGSSCMTGSMTNWHWHSCHPRQQHDVQVQTYPCHDIKTDTVTRFGPKVGQIGPKWDKSGKFSDQIQYILAHRAKMYWIWSEKILDLSHIWGQSGLILIPNLTSVVWRSAELFQCNSVTVTELQFYSVTVGHGTAGVYIDGSVSDCLARCWS